RCRPGSRSLADRRFCVSAWWPPSRTRISCGRHCDREVAHIVRMHFLEARDAWGSKGCRRDGWNDGRNLFFLRLVYGLFRQYACRAARIWRILSFVKDLFGGKQLWGRAVKPNLSISRHCFAPIHFLEIWAVPSSTASPPASYRPKLKKARLSSEKGISARNFMPFAPARCESAPLQKRERTRYLTWWCPASSSAK